MVDKKIAPKDASFLTRVRAALPGLHPAERRLGLFLCDFPGELASYSGAELAALAHVSTATVSRFVKRIGYKNYDAARRHARAEQQTGSRLFLETSSISPAANAVSAHLNQSIANLQKTFLSISDEQINSLAESILQSRKVWVIGFRSSHAFASYLQWQLTQVVENIVAIPGSGQTMGEYLASVTSQDTLIVFGLRRRVAQMDAILGAVKKSRAKLAYITDEGVPQLKDARWHVRCHTASPGGLFNHVTVSAWCHLITTRTIELAGRSGRNRLQDIESFNDSLGEL